MKQSKVEETKAEKTESGQVTAQTEEVKETSEVKTEITAADQSEQKAAEKTEKAEDQLSYTIEIETNKMNLKKNEYSQKSKQSEIDKLQSATQNTEVRSEIDGVIQKIDTSKMTSDDGDSVDDSSGQ